MSLKIKSQSNTPSQYLSLKWEERTEVITRKYLWPVHEVNPEYLEYIKKDEDCVTCRVRGTMEKYQVGWAKWYYKYNNHICDGCRKFRSELVKATENGG